MQDAIRKELNDGVYTIINIRSSEQLKDFYNEVVEKNYEKYCGITVQGTRFGYDVNTGKGYKLVDTTYAINKQYQPKVEEIQAESEISVEVNNIEDSVEPVVEVNEEVKEETKEEDKQVEVDQPKQEIDTCKSEENDSQIKISFLEKRVTEADTNILELNNKICELNDLIAVKDEALGVANNELNELRKIKIKQDGDILLLNNKLMQVDKERSLDELIELIESTYNYKVFLTRK